MGLLNGGVNLVGVMGERFVQQIGEYYSLENSLVHIDSGRQQHPDHYNICALSTPFAIFVLLHYWFILNHISFQFSTTKESPEPQTTRGAEGLRSSVDSYNNKKLLFSFEVEGRLFY